MRILPLTLAAFPILGLILSLTEYRAAILERSAKEFSESITERPIVSVAREDVSLNVKAAEASLSSPKAKAELASTLKRYARREFRLEDQLGLYCKSLSAWGEAVKADPENARYLLNWADLREILAQYECKEALTKGSAEEAIHYALTLDPTNPKTAYTAAVILTRLKKQDAAFPLFKRALETDTAFSNPKRDFIFSLIKDGDDLEALIPARFPQTVEWSGKFLAERPLFLSDYAKQFEKLELEALKLTVKEYELGSIPYELHLERLNSLLPITRSNLVRQTLDAEIARVLFSDTDNSKALRDYLKQRAKLQGLEIISGTTNSDTRPLTSALSGWGEKDSIGLDTFAQTVGFYLPSGQRIQLIEVVSKFQDPPGLRESLRLYVSEDNQTWNDPIQPYSVTEHQVGGETVIGILHNGEYHKYWKLNYAGNSREGFFSAKLPDLLRVYGVSSRGQR